MKIRFVFPHQTLMNLPVFLTNEYFTAPLNFIAIEFNTALSLAKFSEGPGNEFLNKILYDMRRLEIPGYGRRPVEIYKNFLYNIYNKRKE